MKCLIAMLDFRLWQGNGNGGGNGGGVSSGGGGFGTGMWVSAGEGGRQWQSSGGGAPVAVPTPAPSGPAPRVPVVREARNVQRANIDRSSLYDPTAATQELGVNYLQSRNASNPQPQGSTGAGAVGYEFAPSNERLY